jgi:serine/threonine protein kinase/tetratricopeptide (TPR) repeat protein
MGIMASQEQTVEQLFVAALDRRPEDRRAFLDRVCAGAPELRQRLEEMLVADEQAGSFLDKPAEEYNAARPTLEGNGGRANPRVFDLATVFRFEPGQMIASRFAVIRFIARGGMGEVYEVEDRFLQGVHVALKVILPHIAGDAGSAYRFQQEVLLARKVTHPNLCPIYDISHCEEPPPPFLFLTMKMLSGETLASRLQRPPLFSRTENISIFRQMVGGLSAIHAAGVVHRDIKPTNVMLDYPGSDLCLTIMDFGLARLYGSQTTALTLGLIAGTPGYMAPELICGGAPSQATDIFALGVLFQQVLTGDHPNAAVHGLSAKPTPALNNADVPPIFIHSVKEFLSDDPARRCLAFKQIQSTFESGSHLTERVPSDHFDGRPPRILTRRNFIIGITVTACAAAGGVAWKWDTVNNRIDDLIHPLPLKRFVALLNWPPSSDARIRPMLLGIIDTIASELSRAEAFDHDLFVIAPKTTMDMTTPAQLNELRQSLGTNLVLAASGGVLHSGELHLLLRVLDPTTTRTLRERAVNVSLEEQLQLPEKAVRTAAKLLDITGYKPDDKRGKVGTGSPEAYAAFQAAESLMKQENDRGLDPAIEKYKQAIEIDPRYAVAQAKLSWAYLRSYGLHGDTAALMLASANCKSAIQLDPNLVAAHLGLASVYQQTGNDEGASREMSKALSLDPADPHTLIYLADFYAASNRWDKAEDTFARVLKMRPNYWLAHQELGVILDMQGRYREALVEFRSASLASPRNALALKNVGSVYLQLGKLPEALENLRASFDLKQDDETEVAMAEAFRLERRYAEAIDYAQRAVKLNPNEPYHWLELGDTYSEAGRFRAETSAAYRQAATTEEEILRTSPKDGPGWMLLALCRAKAGQSSTALALIAKAESLHADDMDSQLFKVRTLELVGRRDDALSTMARCLRRGPTLFQFESMLDLEGLRTSPGYKSIVTSAAAATQISV